MELIDVATPCTWRRYTCNYKGAYQGWLMSSEIINSQIKKTIPGHGNFYMVGQWATPGGGVVSSLYSGRHVVQILCHGEGKDEKEGSAEYSGMNFFILRNCVGTYVEPGCFHVLLKMDGMSLEAMKSPNSY